MSQTASRFIKNIGFNIISDVSTKIANSLLIILISRYLGVSALGSFIIANTYFNFGLLFSFWGFRNLLIRGIAQDRKEYNKYLSNFGVIRIILASIAIIAINLIVRKIGYADDTYRVLKIISIGILANTLVQLQFSLFIAFEKLKYLSIISLTTNILRLLICVFVITYSGDIVTIALILTIMEFVTLIMSSIITILVFPDFSFSWNLKFSINQINKGIPLFLIAVFGTLDNRIDILLISIFFNEDSVGYYTAMYTFIGALSLISEGIRNAIFPIFARYKIQNEEKLREMLHILRKYIIIFTFPISIFTYLYAQDIIFFLFGSGYSISVTMLKIVVWFFCGFSLTVVNTRLLIVNEKESQVVFLFFISGILTLILNLIFTPRFGIIFVAYIRLLTSYIMLILSTIFLYFQGYKIEQPKNYLKILLACLIMIFTAIIFNPNKPLLASVVSLLLYSLFILVLGVITPKDIKLWKNIIYNFVN